MLVMSLSPLLGQAIPDIAETAEILVFPRRGARSGSSRVLLNLTVKSSRVTRRGIPGGSWVVQGAVLGHAFGTLLGLPAVQVALFTDSSVSFRPNFDKFLKFSVLAGSAKHSRPVSSTTS